MNKTYISTVSSLHPIDLAAFLMMHVISPFDESSDVQILFMQELDVPIELAHRILTARSSVPTPLLLLEKEDVFRQVFVPLDENDSPSNIDSIFLAIDLYIRVLKSKFPTIAEMIEERKKLLIDVLQSLPKRDSETLLLGLTKLILEVAIGKKINIGSYDDYLKSETGQKQTIAGLISIIKEVNSRNLDETQFTFTKGGYISLCFKDETARLEYFEIFQHKTIFWNEHQTVYLEIDNNYSESLLYANDARVEASYTIELRGPLHMIFQAQIGTPIDVPWYFDSVSRSNEQQAFKGIESITPISVSSIVRTSIWAGGEDLRLYPSGYTLLDYCHDNVLAYVSLVAESETMDFDAYEDWRHIYNNYPVSRQRLLKSQSGIPQYCDLRLRDLRQNIVHGDEGCLSLLDSSVCFEIPCLGKTVLALMTTIKFIRDAMATPNIKWSDAQFKLLQDLGIIRNNVPAIDIINWKMREITTHIDRWLKKIALRDTILNSAPKSNASSMILFLEQQKSKMQYASSLDNNNDLVSLDANYRILQKSLYMYYKAVVALGGTVLKANLWTCWLLLGPDEYLKALREIIDKRGEKLLNLSAKVWMPSMEIRSD